MESLGGAATPAVGWAAGIERLAMLVGAREESTADVIVVVEDDSRLSTAFGLLKLLRGEGYSAELIAGGSPKKRFDKAVKLDPLAIVSLAFEKSGLRMNVTKGSGSGISAVVGPYLDANPQ
jgi:histidyl-tRNA synthetase